MACSLRVSRCTLIVQHLNNAATIHLNNAGIVMSRPTSKNLRKELLKKFSDLGRRTSTQTVFLHQAIAQGVGLNATDTKCVDLILTHPSGCVTAGQLSDMTGLTTG